MNETVELREKGVVGQCGDVLSLLRMIIPLGTLPSQGLLSYKIPCFPRVMGKWHMAFIV